MPRKPELPHSRRHVSLYDEDWEFLTTHFGNDSGNRLGVSASIRALVHQYVTRLRAKAVELLDETPRPPVSEQEHQL